MNRILFLLPAAAAGLSFAISLGHAAYLGKAPWCAVVNRRRRRRMGLRIWIDRSVPAQRDRRQSRLLPNKSILFAGAALWRAVRKAGASPSA
jgi:hypothetical protein